MLHLCECAKTAELHTLVNFSISSVQSLRRIQLFVTPWTAAHQAPPVNHQLLELAQTLVHRVGDAVQTSHPVPSPSPPVLSLSQDQGLFQ